MQMKGKEMAQEYGDHHHIDRPIAILGAGNMGSALMKGIINAKLTPAKKIIACDVNPAKLQTLALEWKVRCLVYPMRINSLDLFVE